MNEQYYYYTINGLMYTAEDVESHTLGFDLDDGDLILKCTKLIV